MKISVEHTKYRGFYEINRYKLPIRLYIKKPREKIKSHGAFLHSGRMAFAILSPNYRTYCFGIKGSLEPIATSPAPCKKFSTCRARAAIDFEVAFATAE